MVPCEDESRGPRRFSKVIVSTAYAFLMLLSAAAGAVSAQSFDGAYTGTIACGRLSNLTTALRTQFTVVVSGSEASYERPIVRPARGTGKAEPTGRSERGRGTVSSAGQLALRGECEGEFTCQGQYEGNLDASPVRLVGMQRWQTAGKTEDRNCEVELARSASKG